MASLIYSHFDSVSTIKFNEIIFLTRHCISRQSGQRNPKNPNMAEQVQQQMHSLNTNLNWQPMQTFPDPTLQPSGYEHNQNVAGASMVQE